MTITIVSWNLNHRRPSPSRSAWEYLAHELHADVALVQEAGQPPSDWSSVGDDIGARGWGTRVVSPTHELTEVTRVKPVREREVEYRTSIPGAAATATATIDSTPLTLVSLYGLMTPRNSYAAVNTHLADLVPLLDAPAHFKQTVIGGDLNLTSQWSGENAGYAPIDRAILDQFRAWGMRDLVAESTDHRLDRCPCTEGDACRHRQTLWQPNEVIPRQTDYMFAPRRMRKTVALRIDTAAVHEHRLSDHAPLVATIDSWVDRS